MPRYKMIVLTNAVEGREDEFNDWYSNVHIHDALRVPGIVGAQRFRMTSAQRDPNSNQYEYLAIYDCDADDVQQVIDGLAAVSGGPSMPISSALQDKRYVCLFEPITETEEAKS